ncbi:hypothetical protein YPPY48_1462 [Yersinia pestis PY-48]|nr:hypothetical protein YPPY48_1462 [Yersinia pestis PY-48]
MRRSGITSRSKWANFSRNQTSCSSIGPRRPAVITLLLSTTGAPAAVVNPFFLLIMFSSMAVELIAVLGLSVISRQKRD